MSDTEKAEFNPEGSFRRLNIVEEARIESKLVPHRRGQLYRLLADEIERLRAALGEAKVATANAYLLVETMTAENTRLREVLERLSALAEADELPVVHDIASKALEIKP